MIKAKLADLTQYICIDLLYYYVYQNLSNNILYSSKSEQSLADTQQPTTTNRNRNVYARIENI